MSRIAVAICLLTGLAGCSGSSTTTVPAPGNPGGGEPVAATSMDVVITSPAMNAATGAQETLVTATVYIPEHRAGEPYPLILHSHGWGGSRYSQADVDAQDPEPGTNSTSFFTLIDQRVESLWQAGYAVVSFDERGFGRGDDGDDGTEDGAHSMSMDFEIQDAIAVLDWAVANLDLIKDAPGDPRVGSIGSSYGGGFQLLLAAADERLDAIVPGGTWHSLSQSLAPNDVIKKGYSTGLCVLAQTDNAELASEVQTSCMEGSINQTTRFREELSQGTQDLFDANGLNALVAANVPAPRVDALLIQGNRDILFNLNQAIDNLDYLASAGGDVRLLSHENGHSLTATRNGPGSQGALGHNACGSLDTLDALTAWFDAKLRDQAAAIATLPTVCISLDGSSGAILNDVPRGSATHVVTIASQNLTATNSNLSSATGEAVFIPLEAPVSGNGSVLAGVPLANLTVAATIPGTEAVVFAGIGIDSGRSLRLVDDQVVPLRSSDTRAGDTPETVRLVGVGEPLQDGDVVGVLLYGQHDQFENEARTLYASNAVTVQGSVQIPIVTPASVLTIQ